MIAGPVEAMQKLNLLIHQVFNQRQQFTGVFLLVERDGGFPVSQLGALSLNLFYQLVEGLLSFGKLGLVVAGDHGDGLEMSSGHDLVLLLRFRSS